MSSIPGPRPALKEGDWACPEAKCAAINDQKRITCDQCGHTKPRAKGRVGHEIGKDAAEKSKGLFSADDWQCSKCGNVNWARRNQCNVCNAPKFGEVEVRTGYGGGYMDRQDVEYLRRSADSSDEEYDEFGRKKKKFRNAKDGDSNDLDGARNEQGNVEGDDEDEDDGDEADLAKYRLDDDEDIAEETEKNKNSPTKNKGKPNEEKRGRRSRSRSSSGSSSYSSSSRSRSSSGSSRSTSRSSSSSSSSRSKSRSPRRARGGRYNSGTRSRSPTRTRGGHRRVSRSRSRSRSSHRSRSRRSSSRTMSRSPRGRRHR